MPFEHEELLQASLEFAPNAVGTHMEFATPDLDPPSTPYMLIVPLMWVQAANIESHCDMH